jgi:hypothetical protein
MGVCGHLHALAALPPEKKILYYHWIGGWVDPESSLDAVEQGKICYLCRESNSVPPAPSQLPYRLIFKE